MRDKSLMKRPFAEEGSGAAPSNDYGSNGDAKSLGTCYERKQCRLLAPTGPSGAG
jgi:hypothetical protein